MTYRSAANKMSIVIEKSRTLDVTRIDPLVTRSSSDGFRHVECLRDEWLSGVNRFDGPGEALFVAALDGRAVGVCGLNVDPYANNLSVGRVRRLYVAPGSRRRGIGRALVAAVVAEPRRSFCKVTLRTNADLFFRSMGFERVEGVEAVTNQLMLHDSQ
ncbi:MAG: GNAT family N-acetyltransferase [Chloroflexi bacterium]|nr:GNAT family N-acetyltransferase [Chloroflexota bacterium]